jgi:hypothetical protein
MLTWKKKLFMLGSKHNEEINRMDDAQDKLIEEQRARLAAESNLATTLQELA